MPDPLFKKFTIKHFQEFCDEFGATCPLLFRNVLVLLKAQPDIVRCKECKHRSKELYDYCGNPKDKRYVCEINDVAKKPDWFCADGEREVKRMTKQEILDKFSDIDFAYNDSSKHETLSRMLDELLKEQEAKIEQLNRFVNGFSRDAMPVVRCKDCKHGTANDIGQIQCNMTIGDDDIHEQDWFCADGERKEEGEQDERPV